MGRKMNAVGDMLVLRDDIPCGFRFGSVAKAMQLPHQRVDPDGANLGRGVREETGG